MTRTAEGAEKKSTKFSSPTHGLRKNPRKGE